MKLNVALTGVALCLSHASALTSIAEQAAASARQSHKGSSYVSSNATTLLVAESQQISLITLEPPTRRLVNRTPYLGGIDYHARRQRVYWSEMATGRVNTGNLTGVQGSSNQSVVELSPKVWRPRRIVIDPTTDNMYVLDSRGKTIHVVDLTRRWRTVISEGELKAPTDIAIDPEQAVMFVADRTRILKSNMDGSGSTVIVIGKRYQIRALALDTASKRIFWSDVSYHRIKSANYNGMNVRVLVKNEIGHAYSVLGPAQLAYCHGTLYFYDDVYRKISAVQVERGVRKSDHLTLVYRQLSVKSLRVLNCDDGAIAKARNPCDGAKCEQMCLTARKVGDGVTSVCACDVGTTIAEDGTSCL
ncbi:low-density lipoprotein receptor-related protein 4-like [Phymastichus coffea]|uniref:low-density lipoprotein receptor-related protein 4-like n=1 Tax=Phymastichus coffea TaxID=108790 RepID=UPI00273B4BB6|nr:low-density lipoprotein receptor-related protein 4-like [Phymastichus coffea]